jgi:hypothetical protein
VTVLESYVNEIFVDRDKYFPQYSKQLTDDIWVMTEKGAILDKYSFVLSLKDKGRFDKEQKYYREAVDLIKLRTTLVHFKPEWSHEEGEHKKLMKRLRSKFPLSPYFQNAVGAFPNSIMEYGCAKWSVKTTINFISRFSEIAEIENKPTKFNDRLSVS